MTEFGDAEAALMVSGGLLLVGGLVATVWAVGWLPLLLLTGMAALYGLSYVLVRLWRKVVGR